jgi:hypothetical protein
MKKAILLNSYVGDQLKTVVSSDYSWAVATSTEQKTTVHKHSPVKAVKKKTVGK